MANTQSSHRSATTPYTDIHTSVVLDRALLELADRRFVPTLDARVQLNLLACLIAQAESWVAEQLCVARADGATWAEIGRLLGTTATAARQRWGPVARRRHDHNVEAPFAD